MSLPARALRKARNIFAPRLRPLGGVLRRLRRRSLAVVMYHGVTDDQTEVPDWCQVRVDDFRRQMEFLRDNYFVISLGEAVRRIGEGAPLPDRAVCLTFDDGFRNVMTQAAPILDEYQLPSTVFLVTSLLDSGLPPWPGMLLYALSKTTLTGAEFDGEQWLFEKGRKGLPVYDRLVRRVKALPGGPRESRFEELIGLLGAGSSMDFMKSPRATMTWAEVEKLAAPGLMRFESHTHTHASLSHCTIDEQKKELEISRNMLRARMPIENLFCYPFGDYSRATNEIVAQTGYRCALTTDSGLNSGAPDVYSLRRVLVGGNMPAATFEMAMLGCCE